MYILLSSGAQKRYRDDIAKCMAAPIGGTVQFRYNTDIVERGVWTSFDVDTKKLKAVGKQGLVCFLDVDSKSSGGEHPVIPVRMVHISQISVVGSSVVIDLTMEAFGYADDLIAFQADIHKYQQAPLHSEALAETSRSGRWCFEYAGDLSSVRSTAVISDWEEIGEQLTGTTSFADVGFFWTVLGLHEGAAQEAPSVPSFLPWSATLKMEKIYTLLIYTARPGIRKTDSPRSKSVSMGQLLVRTEPSHNSFTRDEILVDSPYDLKRWSFKMKRPSLTYSDPGWMRIGEEALDESTLEPAAKARNNDQKRRELKMALTGTPDWELELPLCFDKPGFAVLGVAALLGVLFSAPSLLAIFNPANQSVKQKLGASVVALCAAVGGSVVAIYQIKKPT